MDQQLCGPEQSVALYAVASVLERAVIDRTRRPSLQPLRLGPVSYPALQLRMPGLPLLAHMHSLLVLIRRCVTCIKFLLTGVALFNPFCFRICFRFCFE